MHPLLKLNRRHERKSTQQHKVVQVTIRQPSHSSHSYRSTTTAPRHLRPHGHTSSILPNLEQHSHSYRQPLSAATRPRNPTTHTQPRPPHRTRSTPQTRNITTYQHIYPTAPPSIGPIPTSPPHTCPHTSTHTCFSNALYLTHTHLPSHSPLCFPPSRSDLPRLPSTPPTDFSNL